MNAAEELIQADEAQSTVVEVKITLQMKIMLNYLTEYGEMKDENLKELLNVKKTYDYLIACQMNENGLIEIEGHGAKNR